MIITTASVTTFLLKLGEKGLEKAFETGGEKISENSINWIKGLFFKDGKPKKALKELQDEPDNKGKQEIAKSIFENSIEENGENMKYFEELVEKLHQIQNTTSYSKNIVTGNITSGGSSIVGDGNVIN